MMVYVIAGLGETIKRTRVERQLTQYAVAKLSGVSRRHLADLEKGRNVSLRVLLLVIGALPGIRIELDGAVIASTLPPPSKAHPPDRG